MESDLRYTINVTINLGEIKMSKFKRIFEERGIADTETQILMATCNMMLGDDPDGSWSMLQDYGIDVDFETVQEIWKELEELRK